MTAEEKLGLIAGASVVIGGCVSALVSMFAPAALETVLLVSLCVSAVCVAAGPAVGLIRNK